MSYLCPWSSTSPAWEFPVCIGRNSDSRPREHVLALLLIGIYLDFSLTGAEWRRIAKVLALRYSLGIAVGAALYVLLPVGPLHRGIIAIGLILPVGMSTIPYAVEFGYDTRLAGMMVNATNILSFIIMWIISALIINA